MRLLADYRPTTPCSARRARTTRSGSTSDRVWIVDPLDGTREYSEPPRDDWAIHVALWQDGDLVAGAVAQPGHGDHVQHRRAADRAAAQRRPAAHRRQPHPPTGLRRGARPAQIDAELVPMGSAGAKVISVARDVTDIYVHAGGQYEWDSAAPVVVARAAGLHTSRADGAPLAYNQDDVWLPDLLVCRPEFADGR